MAFAFNKPVVFIETNIRRTYIYHFLQNRRKVSDAEIEPLIARSLDRKNPREWYWALMDYGATLGEKSRGHAKDNPNVRSKHYVRQSQFAGSDRELRGKLLKLLLNETGIVPMAIAKSLHEKPNKVRRVVSGLVREGFLVP
jgi:A/G-specific adenine glycosylase